MKKPLGPEDVVEALRERIKKEDLTLTASDVRRYAQWLGPGGKIKPFFSRLLI